MRKIRTLIAAGLFLTMATSAHASSEADGIALLEANIVLYEAILAGDDLSRGERRQAEVGKKQLEKLIARIEKGVVKDVHKAIDNNPFVISPA